MRPVLGEHRHHGRAVVGERRVDRRRHLDLDVRAAAGRRASRPARRARGSRSTGRSPGSCAAARRLDEPRGSERIAVDLHAAAARAVAAHVLGDLVGQVLLADEVEHRGLRVRAGEHDRGVQLLAVGQRDAGDAAVHDVDRDHRRVDPDDRPERPRAAAIASEIAPIPPLTWPHAPPTPSSSPSSWWSRLYAVPGVRGPAHTPTTPRGRVRALERVVLEVVVEQVADRHRHHAVELVEAPGAEARRRGPPPAAARTRRPGCASPAPAAASIIGRRTSATRSIIASKPAIASASLRRHARDRLVGLALVVVEEDRRPVRGEGPERRVERDRVIAEALELEVAHHLRAQHRDHVGRARDALPGPDLLGHARAAEQLAPLQHADRSPARARYAAAVSPLWPPPTTIASKLALRAVAGCRCR